MAPYVLVFQITFIILCVYTVIYATGFMLNKLPDIIDSTIYFVQYIKSLKDKDS